MQSPNNPIPSALPGGDIPEAVEERRKEIATDATNVHPHGIIGGETLEPETRGGLGSGIHNRARKKQNEPETKLRGAQRGPFRPRAHGS